jgi:hypothetical protein
MVARPARPVRADWPASSTWAPRKGSPDVELIWNWKRTRLPARTRRGSTDTRI